MFHRTNCAQTLVVGVLLVCFAVQVAQAVGSPEDFHWTFVEELVHDWIDHSSCPNDPTICDSALGDKCKDNYPGGKPPGGLGNNLGHWDWNLKPKDGPGSSADCVLFPQRRNPFPLGSRLLRLAFHDAMGTVNGTHSVDGFLDLYNENATKGARNHSTNGRGLNPEHNGLDSAIVLLDDLYENEKLPTEKCDYPCDNTAKERMDSRLTKTDFYVWAYLASVTHASAAYTRVADLSDNGWNIPKMKVRYGYKNKTQDKEVPPPSGTNTENGAILAYFSDEFGFEPEEVVALMGAHTLGGGRLETSGHTGMWTQSKTQFNTAYYSNLANPTPLSCPETAGTAGGEDTCTYLQCDPDTDRCQGWEQIEFPFTDPFTGEKIKKFQWRHSCAEPNAADRDCTHLMLNVDMALYRDIDDHLCVDGDCDPICDGGNRLGLMIGKVKSFPDPLPSGMTAADCNVSNPNGRLLATCFHKANSTASHVETLDNSLTTFLSNFAAVFERLLDVNGLNNLTTTGTLCTAEGTIDEGTQLTEAQHSSPTCDSEGGSNPFPCCVCRSGVAAANQKATKFFCRPKGWTEDGAGRRSGGRLPSAFPVYDDSEEVEAASSQSPSGVLGSSAGIIVLAGIFGSALTIFGLVARVASRRRRVAARGENDEKTLTSVDDEDIMMDALGAEDGGDEEC